MRAKTQRIINTLRKAQGSYAGALAMLEDPVLMAAFGHPPGDPDVAAALEYVRPLVGRDTNPHEELSFYLDGEPHSLPVLRLREDYERADRTQVVHWDGVEYRLLLDELGEPFGVYPR